MELLIERRHRFRNLTEYGSFGPGVYTNYDTKVFLNEVDGGLQLDIFDPRELYERRLVDGIDGDTVLDGRFTDQRNKSLKEARLLDSSDVLTTDLNAATTIEIESHSGYIHRFEVIDLAGETVSDDGLVGHWKFDEASGSTATDSSSEGNDGTIIGATRVTTSGAPVPGGAGGALSFDGVDDLVDLDNPASMNFTGEITLAAWVKVGATDGYRNIIGHGLGLNPHGEVFLRIDDGRYEIGSWNGGFNKASAAIPAEDTANGGQWVHLAGVYDGAIWRLYRNGMLIGVTQDAPGSVITQTDWSIGARGTGTSRYFDGEIDDVRIYNRNLLEGDIVQLAQQRVLAGRLTSIEDRNGYSTDLTYKTFTQAEIDLSPERQWQIDTVTDPYSRTATYQYKSTQVAGHWVVERIDLPNGSDVDYLYEDGLHLTKAVHADGTESTFTYGSDTVSQTTTVTFDDASADTTHRRKTAYLTNVLVVPGYGLGFGEIYNQSAMLVRLVTNGSDEVSYLHLGDPAGDGGNANAIYEGAGKLRYLQGARYSRHYKDGWSTGDPALGFDSIQGQKESKFEFIPAPFWSNNFIATGTYSRYLDKRGSTFDLTYDADTFKTLKTYTDATSESWAYNGFKQVTLQTDRLGRQTRKTYDANGNLLTREVGIVSGVNQPAPEYATYTNTYYDSSEGPAVAGITGAAMVQPVSLLKSSADANGNVTNYVYDDDNFLIATIAPADRVGDARAIELYSYDSAGRLQTTTDPLGRVTTYAYDARDRMKTVTYEDDSTSEVFYANELAGGAGNLSNLVVAAKDRNDNYTQYRYDGHGRRVTTIRGITTEADALNLSFIPDTTYHDVEECTYLDGTNLKATCIRNGERTEYVYDYRHRLVQTIVYPRDSGAFPFAVNLIDPDGAGSLVAGDDTGVLITSTIYRDNLRFATIDPYGRATFYAYRASDSSLIRTVKETVPGGSGIDPESGTFAQVINLTRDVSYEDVASLGATTSGGGAAYLITDMVKDAEAQTTSTVDPRNVEYEMDYDSRGRTIETVVAVGTTVEAKAETIYDEQSNVVESRSPRYFDSGDTEGFNIAYTTMTYTGRNLLASKTVAAGDSTYDTYVTTLPTPTGLGAKATEVMYYYLDGRHEKTIDFNGNDPQFTAADHEWLTIWRQCCERIRATIDPEGHGQAQGTDFNGNVAHTVVVDSLIDDVVVDGTTGARTITDSDFNGIPGYWDAPDSRTLAETTTRFDSKNRPVASTVWLEPLDLVDPNDPPILYGSSIIGSTRAQSAATGLGAGDGLTTLYYYSEDLYETPVVTAGVEGPPVRGVGEDNAFLVHQFSDSEGAPVIDLNPSLTIIDGLGLLITREEYTNASAMATINPEGEISLSIMDGVGRPVFQAMLDPTTFAPVTWSTISHDRVSDAIATSYGDTLETLSISALEHLNRSFTDGVGRTIETEDAEGEVSYAIYDNNGNAIRTRNANAIGQDCDFDPRNRLTSCTDTQGDTTTRTYNQNNQVINGTDGKLVANAADTVYDARGRAVETTSRLDVLDTNKASYDPNGNLLTQTDAQSGVTTYEYDPRNLRIATLMPGHNTSSVVGDSDYDRAEMAYDAMRRPLLKTDQQGDTCVYTYDLASRLLTREYRLAANSTPLTNGLPTGTIADTDTFTYDDASRPLTAIKGRYSNTVTFAYDDIGRPTSEALTTNGVTYTTGYTNYDDDSRLTTLTYPDGSTVATTYTDRNQAEDITYDPDGPGGTLPATIATMAYDPGMRQASNVLGNGLDTTFTYRAGDNQLASLEVETAPGAGNLQALHLDYTYDANKNMLSETRAAGNTSNRAYRLSYSLAQDAKDRMTSWTRINTLTDLDSQSWDLSFESDWNDTTLTDGGVGTTQTRTHNAPHELLTIDPDGAGALPAFSQTHDAKGNLTADGDGLAHTFDFDNMLQQVVVAGASPRGDEGTHTYAYDALGRRVSKSVDTDADNLPDETTVFVCAGHQVIAEYVGGSIDTDPERKYIFSATGYIDAPLALIDATGGSEVTLYYHRDRQYSIIGLTNNTNGAVVERYAYTAYGEVTITDGAGLNERATSLYGNPYTYTGRRTDHETGLCYFRARYHDPVLGRFLERDPLGYPDGLNTYAAYHVLRGGVDPFGLEMSGFGMPLGDNLTESHDLLKKYKEEIK
ncbi:MAG: hypothetical protein KTR15_01335, partial [Phycisphaeraceae bacterium]|nr:hypothetical protein [Phycisphaeraceae bacterium]